MLKGVSFLPNETGVYEQMPYEEISGDEYGRRMGALSQLSFTGESSFDPEAENYCDACES